MSRSLTGPPQRPLDPAHAWGMTAANLLLWPGLGTALARRKTGLVQMGFSGAGAVMALAGFVGLYGQWILALEFPGWRGPYGLMLLCGTGLFLLTWLWALFSSIALIRAAQKPGAPLPPTIPSAPESGG